MADFEELYMEHFQHVYRFIFSLCRDVALAEEITQETFYKALTHLDQFKGECKLYVWLCQIAKNTYLTYVAKQKRTVSDDGTITFLSHETENVENKFFDKETAGYLHKLLHEMDEPYKEVFSLRVFGELPFDQIGELFGKSASWARVIFYRGKATLRRKLDEHSM